MSTLYCFGDDAAELSNYAWYIDNAGSETHPVGKKKPNDFGVYDAHGNAGEWVEDTWHDWYVDAPSDGSVWTKDGDSDVPHRAWWIDVSTSLGTLFDAPRGYRAERPTRYGFPSRTAARSMILQEFSDVRSIVR